jgi:hypothetical protein
LEEIFDHCISEPVPHPRRLRRLFTPSSQKTPNGKATLATGGDDAVVRKQLAVRQGNDACMSAKPFDGGEVECTDTVNLFNYKELQWKEWTSASMTLHQAMIN